ncbi:protein-lysine methyltransferase METTL21D [Amborella trichopoda]|uniref:Methyltransferase type 12 domain-containing protein n=1 Tax=Amborella trichopoda TaxID=13333 RepID=W1Q116_AMBTC|nr:protein-lysine methyltransferase METTL21D [Amborella trichopoda]ERN14040.1 hypothetical protein AMTR_s00021p00207470 [Amborella trichopoda]|eukprot:XP_006852573.1 protein-lysine methyltransferase METTL21D [Amborella trichopoda]
MKFTDSPVISLPIGDKSLTIEQDNSSMHVGTSVWPCSLVVAKFVERWVLSTSPQPENPYSFLFPLRSRRAIELGSGCGPAGMALALLGLDVTLTDIAPVMPALKRNLKRNLRCFSGVTKPRAVQLYWNNEQQVRALKPPFDFVIATDVVYLENGVEPLLMTMEKLCGPESVVLLGYQLRSPEADRLFWEMCPRFFRVEKVRHEDLHPEYAFDETDVFILRKI